MEPAKYGEREVCGVGGNVLLHTLLGPIKFAMFIGAFYKLKLALYYILDLVTLFILEVFKY